MKKFTFVFIIILLIALSGCTNNNLEEIDTLTNQVNKLSKRIDNYEELTSNIESLSSRIANIEKKVSNSVDNEQLDLVENELKSISTNLSKIQVELQFIENTVYNRSLFKADDIEVGELVSSMILVEKNYNKAWRLLFSGEVELTGEYRISENDEYYGRDVIFFDVDDDNSKNVLPRALGDNRHLWFVIRNYEDAYNLLINSGLEGEATVVVDNYLIDLLQSDVVNEADLIKVIVSK